MAHAEHDRKLRRRYAIPGAAISAPLVVAVAFGLAQPAGQHVEPGTGAALCVVVAFFACELALAVRPLGLAQRPERAASRATSSYFLSHGAEVPELSAASSLSATFTTSLTELGPEEVCADGTLVRTPWCLVRDAVVTDDYVVLPTCCASRDDGPGSDVFVPSRYVDGGAAVLPRTAVGGRAACRALARDARARVREARGRARRARRMERRGDPDAARALLAPELAWLGEAERLNAAAGLPTSGADRPGEVGRSAGPYPPECLLAEGGPWW